MTTSTHRKELRLFVAITLSREVRRSLSEAQSQLRRRLGEGPRWVRPEGSHLTIKFLGNTPEDRVGQVKEAISSACRGKSPFAVSTAQLGSFGSPRRPTVIWLGLNGDMAPLRDLHKHLEDRLATMGWPRETKRFSPHLTLARMPQRISPQVSSRLPAALAEVKVPATSMPVSQINLIRSILQPDGAQYSDIATFPLE
ncbi:MAG: RNA 2',3'-cyclic phosphodiesterase [Dehalococcoidia bacterium]|nr:RNA 2',3'-cyclic phosphodiesterase [Dehalococcoidia bacterium]